MAVAEPAMFAVGDIVRRLRSGHYDLNKTNKILGTEIKFKGLSHASTLKAHGDSVVEWVDEHGALVSYDQKGKIFNMMGSLKEISNKGSYKTRGLLYYKFEDLQLVKKPDGTINNYSIY
jgi:hypothetical protein